MIKVRVNKGKETKANLRITREPARKILHDNNEGSSIYAKDKTSVPYLSLTATIYKIIYNTI